MKRLFNHLDPFLFQAQLSAEELMIQSTAKKYAQSKLMPRVKEGFRHEKFDPKMIREMGELGLLGIRDFHKQSYTSYGLVAREIERVDSGYRSVMSVQSSLVIHPISKYGTEDQKERYLEKLASGELIGCFGLTESNAGSNPQQMSTTAHFDGNQYILNGSKMWITNSPIANIMIIWAKETSGAGAGTGVSGFIVEKDSKGVTTPVIDSKMSLRASITGSIYLDNVRVSKHNKLNSLGLGAPFSCLNSARFGIGFATPAVGEFCYDLTRDYALNRIQFGKPLAQNQLIQMKLADMLIEITLANQAALRLARLKDNGEDNYDMTSILKRNNVRKMLDVTRTCRDILGGNGISDEYHVIRHMLNLEAVNTYEGTADIHGLILGKAITGLNAF